MTLTNIIVAHSMLAGLLAVLLIVFTIFFEKKRSRTLLLWAMVFLIAHFTLTEYAFWLEGYNVLSFVLTTPGFYFGAWAAFLLWLFESRGERKVWIALLVLAVLAVLILLFCPWCNWPFEFPPKIEF
jgi:D-alanyl-lipoteichoic acid acyltransferase DltB (MBOAT superfamily)